MSGLDEKTCEVCGRHVMADPQPATGWFARCGRRLTRIDECGTADACIDPSASVTPADVGEEPVSDSEETVERNPKSWAAWKREAERVTRERDEARAWSERHHADLLAAEAKLAEARKVIEDLQAHEMQNLNLTDGAAEAFAELTALRTKLETVEAETRERIAAALDEEADLIPCAEDAMVTRSNARLVRANFSYEEAERLEVEEDAAAIRNLEPRHD